MNNQAKCRLLIAEDDYLISEEIKRVLRGSRFEIVGEASNGREAVEMTCALKPDAVLMDIKMPVIDGLKAAATIQKKSPTAIVFLTAHDSKDFLQQACEVGAAAYLIKPPKVEEIDRAVTLAVSRHKFVNNVLQLNSTLEESISDYSHKLDEKSGQLSRLNEAVKILIQEVQQNRAEFEEKLVINVKSFLDPYLKKLEANEDNHDEHLCAKLIRSNLDKLFSPMSLALTSRQYNLTPREIEVADLVRHGSSNKEISRFLNLSIDTVKFHRANIRKKMNLSTDQNLRSYLLSCK